MQHNDKEIEMRRMLAMAVAVGALAGGLAVAAPASAKPHPVKAGYSAAWLPTPLCFRGTPVRYTRPLPRFVQRPPWLAPCPGFWTQAH